MTREPSTAEMLVLGEAEKKEDRDPDHPYR